MKENEHVLHDADIREPLFDFLEEKYGTMRILEEMNIGDSRADAVMVTPSALYGIEIKSDADTYARLARQVKDYDAWYDFNWLVVGSTHAASAKDHVPWYWGILSVEIWQDRMDFYVVREPEANPECTLQKQIQVLWRPELVKIQEACQLPAYKEKSKAFVQERILEKVKPEVLKPLLCEILMDRDYTLIFDEINAWRKANGKHKRRRKSAKKASQRQRKTLK